MDLSEILFLGGFIVFISAILLLDMFVIDKKAHVVSIKEAGTWTAVWIALALLFSVFLWFHGDMVHGIENFSDLQTVASRYAAHLKLDPNDFEASLQQYRHYMTVSYISGYLIEAAVGRQSLRDDDDFHILRSREKRVSACAELGNPRCHSVALRIHLPRCCHHQPLRLGAACLRCRACI